MKRFLFLIFVLSSCDRQDTIFNCTKMAPSGIVIEDYHPVTEDQLKRYLTSVNDTLKYDSINVFLWGSNIQKINPRFKEKYFHSSLGRMTLKDTSNDTAKALMTYAFHFGTLKEGRFNRQKLYDSVLLENKFVLDK